MTFVFSGTQTSVAPFSSSAPLLPIVGRTNARHHDMASQAGQVAE